MQWGNKKRSRGPRAENRVVTDEWFIQERQMFKTQKRVVIPSGAEKQGKDLRTCPTHETTDGSVLNRYETCSDLMFIHLIYLFTYFYERANHGTHMRPTCGLGKLGEETRT